MRRRKGGARFVSLEEAGKVWTLASFGKFAHKVSKSVCFLSLQTEESIPLRVEGTMSSLGVSPLAAMIKLDVPFIPVCDSESRWNHSKLSYSKKNIDICILDDKRPWLVPFLSVSKSFSVRATGTYQATNPTLVICVYFLCG